MTPFNIAQSPCVMKQRKENENGHFRKEVLWRL